MEKAKIEKTRKKTEKPSLDKEKLIAIVRIDGEVKVKPDIKQTLDKLRLRRKYTCVLVSASKSFIGMIDVVKHSTAFGEIERDTLAKLLKVRAKKIDNEKFNPEEVADELLNGKKLEDFKIKPFFRLHPPRGGIKSKLQYPKGVLGNNKNDINKLIERML